MFRFYTAASIKSSVLTTLFYDGFAFDLTLPLFIVVVIIV
jgi:hypothetical protein